MFRFLFNRRGRWLEEGLSPKQAEVLRGLPEVQRLSEDQFKLLCGKTRVMLEEKTFEACGGIALTEQMKLVIAGYAALMLLGEASDYFPALTSILVYPKPYIAPVEDYDEAGIVTTGHERRFGESWEFGSLVLAWNEIERHLQTGSEDNLVIHEFAHQLDDELGISLETERVLNGNSETEWAVVMARKFEAFSRNPRRLPSVDPYGAEDLHEFFAVLSELYFTRPEALRQDSEQLYKVMAHIYNPTP
ncbi:MAG: zinc-dependent peptidase [Balneolales bacterium]|nr:zinc-dependent peptidase [Balneolales bacterium]